MPAKVIIKTNGSIRIEGDFELFDVQGNKFDIGSRTHVSLCRCGESKDKPLCDGAHRECGFESEIVARTLPPPKPKA
jgi:CDGSH-type Zn-finger protein